MASDTVDLPALLGGPPVRPGGPPAWPLPDPDVRAALAAAVASGAWGQYHGDHVRGLEAELAAFHQVPHALTCASGTLAVEAALRALRVGPGDEVVLAAYDYESNFLTVHALGAKPVLVDVAPHNWNLDPAHLAAACTPHTKAVVCSHLHGGIVPMREVVEVARKHGVGVVEDAAQAPGATIQGQPAGTWGDVGTLSFGGSKLLAAGRGGALLVRDPPLFQRAKVWLHRGVQQWAPLSELQAAALRPQLAKLPEATAHRGRFVARVVERIGQAGVPGLVPFENAAADSRAAYYKVGFRFDAAAFGLSRDLFVTALRAEGIAFDAGFNALHVGRSPSRFRAVGDLAHATAAHHGCVVLHHPVLAGSPADAQQVADAVAKVYRHRAAVRSAAS
jgi:dTDP-4-amino-4,6-dideoxygalactose transaminase